MPAPPKPNPPRLFGSSPSQREASRREQSLVLTWDSVSGANGYDLRFGSSDVRSNVSQGGTFGALSRNTRYEVRVRAFNDDGASDWSDPANIATRPARPVNLRLTGSPESRRHNSLEITWNIADTPPTYDIEINSTVTTGVSLSAPARLGTPSFTFLPNQRQTIRLRARDNANGGVSFWSDHGSGQFPLDTATRPNPSVEIRRVRIDMFGYGVRLVWKVDAPSTWTATSMLIRNEGASSDEIHEVPHAANGVAEYTFNDLDYRYGTVRLYSAKVVVPRASVPGDVLGSDNESIDNPEVGVSLPISLLSASTHGRDAQSGSGENSLTIGTSTQPRFPSTSPWVSSDREQR